MNTPASSTCISVMNIRRQKHFILYKYLGFLSISLFLYLLVYNSECEYKNRGFKNSENFLLGVNKTLIEERQTAKKENVDEFLEEVLKTTEYQEINLFSSRSTSLPYRVYDSAIHKMEARTANYSAHLTEVPLEFHREADQIFKKEAFNRMLSEMLPLDRNVPDTREMACRNLSYIKKLPTLSVIIIYNNEALVSILRTVHSVINRTPAKILKEIILVDDFSSNLDLQKYLERYLATRISPLEKMRLLKLGMRSGLIRSRMLGAHVATGDVLAFLDAHCEANVGWAEPLLDRIATKENTVVSPVIDNIDKDTLEYSHDDSGIFQVGSFQWDGSFNWRNIPKYERTRKKANHEPTRTPIIAGGLFAVSRRYFWNMGSYDPGMWVWGGENLEISLRVWICGGTVEIIPCSRVGHIFRDFRPYGEDREGEPNSASWNSARVAEVWLDEWKQLYHFHKPEMNGQDFGDVEARRNWRAKKGCKSFSWFLENIYPDKFKSYLQSREWGQLKNPESGLCLDNMQYIEGAEHKVELWSCNENLSATQLYFWSKKGELRSERGCVVWDTLQGQLMMKACAEDAEGEMIEKWRWDKHRNGRMIHIESGKCLTLKREYKKGRRQDRLQLETCKILDNNIAIDNIEEDSQTWVWSR